MSCTGLHDIDDGDTTIDTASSAMARFGEKSILALGWRGNGIAVINVRKWTFVSTCASAGEGYESATDLRLYFSI